SSWRIPADGSQQPVRITEKFASYPVISPDNRSVAYFYKDDQSSPWRIGISPIDGGPPTRSFDLPPSFERPLRWTGDGRGLAYIDTRNGVSNIVVQPLSGGPPKPLTDFKSDSILWFDISRDGKRLALAKGRVTNDVVLMSDPGTYK
ncbi:MAG TPA: hypothetical protein VL501_03885, partial [Pyrinomonadaceae bacterium]|nr:hypothetical protein [Pyrinomonadaceae bacterium]